MSLQIEWTANREKYIRIKEITITLDHNINFTQLISIDLETLKEVSLITMPFIEDSILKILKQILFF
jgi:hypothetical protein